MFLTYSARACHRSLGQRQRGVALFVVIVFVLLSMLLALWASRTSMFNELVVGNDADYQRAFEAAQALLQDAELDIRGERADGLACDAADVSAQPDEVCRRGSVTKIPLEAQELSPMLAYLHQQPVRCRHGLCTRRTGRQDFWNNNTINDSATGEFPLSALTVSTAANRVGARYGQYTGALTGSSSAPANSILADRSADNRGGWYWIEVLPYDESSKSANLIPGSGTGLLPLNLTPSVVYRVTALAYGRKTNASGDPVTMVVLQETYAPTRRKD